MVLPCGASFSLIPLKSSRWHQYSSCCPVSLLSHCCCAVCINLCSRVLSPLSVSFSTCHLLCCLFISRRCPIFIGQHFPIFDKHLDPCVTHPISSVIWQRLPVPRSLLQCINLKNHFLSFGSFASTVKPFCIPIPLLHLPWQLQTGVK